MAALLSQNEIIGGEWDVVNKKHGKGMELRETEIMFLENEAKLTCRLCKTR